MIMKLYLHILFSIFLAVPSLAAPQAETTTLEGAVLEALKQRPLLLSAQQDVAMAKAGSRASTSKYMPRLTLSEQFYATNEPGKSLFIRLNQENLELSPSADAYNDPADHHDFETRLSLSQPLYDPAIYYGRKKSLVRLQAAEGLLLRAKEDAVFEVLQAYLAVQQHKVQNMWAVQYQKEAEQVLYLSREREAAGVGLHAETLRSAVMLNDARRSVLSSSNAVAMARSQLAMVMGRAQGEVDVAVSIAPDWIPGPVLSGGLQRGDLQALAENVRESKLTTAEQQAAYLPKASLQASYILHDESTPFGSDGEAWTVSAGLEWVLFDFAERSHLLDQAKARKRALELKHLEQERRVRQEVRNAMLKAEEAALFLELAQSSLEAADAARLVIVDRYASGLATLSELLEVQTELARCRRDLAKAEVKLVEARAYVHYQEGTLLGVLGIQGEK